MSTRAAPESPAIWEVLQESRTARPALRTWEGDRYEDVSWDDWRAGALRAAAALRGLGVGPGARVGCLLTNSFATIRGLFGVWMAGGAVASVPTPARGMSPDRYQRQLRSICRNVGIELLLVEGQFAPLLAETAEDAGARVASFESLDASPIDDPQPPSGDELAFIQFSSGSTGDPRGCMLSARAIDRQVDILGEAMELDAGDCEVVSWLPLSHDMGLFGALFQSWRYGFTLDINPPQRFLAAPRTWIQDCSDFQATHTVAPNFALALVTRAGRVAGPSRPFPLRACVLGGERCWWETLDAADEVLGPYGMGLDAMVPAYGLAEATLAVTARSFDELPRAIDVDRAALMENQLLEVAADDPVGTAVVSCGHPLREVEVRIEGGEVGRICVRSPSLAMGYAGEPDVTAERFRDGEFRTQDLGFMRDGQLYVVGRVDDVLCFGGRNVYAGEIEAAMNGDIGVRPGSSALVELEGADETLVLVAEPSKQATDLKEVATSARRKALELAGLRIGEVVFVAPGSLPKTPSGKVQRFRCRELAAGETEEQVLARLR